MIFKITVWQSTIKIIVSSALIFSATLLVACTAENKEVEPKEEQLDVIETSNDDSVVDDETFLLPEIDLNHWKVTLPIAENGKTIEVEPPEILDYASNDNLKSFMYNDSTDGSLVFHTYPGASTPNSSYSRTELREQMEPGSNSVNWTFAQGGRMIGTLSVPEVSKDANGEFYRTIVMQIHGRLTNAQRDLIGENDNNAPPILKIYWDKGKIRVKTKVLKDLNATEEEILHTTAWEDDDGHTFPEVIETNKFSLEVIASEGRLEVILNDKDSVVYDDVHMSKWGVFENYFKAGNYLQSTDMESHAKVKYYALEVIH